MSEYARAQGWCNAGEEAAVRRVADSVRDRAILDLGVGAGRTTTLLLPLSADYVGIDYTPAMVEACQAAHPGVDVRLGDARHLVDVADRSKALVMFSYNGLDALDQAGRVSALAEIARVLSPAGFAIVSTLNIAGPLRHHRPWHLRRLVGDVPHPVVRALVRLPFRLGSHLRGLRNWRRLRRLGVVGPGWAIAPISAHEFSILAHFTTLGAALDDVAAAGLAAEVVYGDNGSMVDGADDGDVDSFTMVLRRVGLSDNG